MNTQSGIKLTYMLCKKVKTSIHMHNWWTNLILRMYPESYLIVKVVVRIRIEMMQRKDAGSQLTMEFQFMIYLFLYSQINVHFFRKLSFFARTEKSRFNHFSDRHNGIRYCEHRLGGNFHRCILSSLPLAVDFHCWWKNFILINIPFNLWTHHKQ